MDVEVQARYCSFENNGEQKYYYCQRNEYCCNFGCCLSPTFQFYQLWYYWLMVIFMFLLCSGGQWWYRYWLQGRYSGDLGSSMPPSSAYRGTNLHHPSQRRQPRPARVSYHPSRDAVVLQHIWKPNYPGGSGVHNSPPPAYSHGSGGGGGTCLREARSLDGDDSGGTGGGEDNQPKPSPYFQLYGPPPPYEQVIREQQQQSQQLRPQQQPEQLEQQPQEQQDPDVQQPSAAVEASQQDNQPAPLHQTTTPAQKTDPQSIN